MNWIKRRLREPSTWAGLAALVPLVVQVVGEGGSPEQIGAIAAAAAAVLMKEGKNNEAP